MTAVGHSRTSRLVLSVGLALLAGVAGAEPPPSVTKTLNASYADGSSETYQLEYTIDVGSNVSEAGGPAKPLEGKFIDDRRCSWTITASVKRTLYLINRKGERFQKGPATIIPVGSAAGQGGGFSLSNLKAQDCNDARGQISADEAKAEATVANLFPNVVAADLAASLTSLQSTLGAARIEVAPS